MKDWEFLIQREDDRTWLPLETSAVELLEGRYRMIYRCDRHPNTSVDVRIIHHATSEVPPKRRVQKRTSRTNQEGLMVVVPFTRFKPGVWEFHCSSDLMTDFFGDSWHHQVRIEILSHTVEAETRWDFPEDAGADSLDYAPSLALEPEEDYPADQTAQLPTVNLPQFLTQEAELAAAARASDFSTASSVLLPLQITLEREPYLICRGQGLVLTGQVDVSHGATLPNPLPPVVGQLQICLRNPENSEVVLDRWYQLPQEVPPLPFHCDLTVPADCPSRLLLSELSVYGSLTPNAPAEILASHGFAVVVDVDELLAQVTPHLQPSTEVPAEVTPEMLIDPAHRSVASQLSSEDQGDGTPQPAAAQVIRRGVRVDVSLLQLVDTPKTERVAFRMSGRAGLPPKLTVAKSNSTPSSHPPDEQPGDAVPPRDSAVRKSPQLPSFGRRGAAPIATPGGAGASPVARPTSSGATATLERSTLQPQVGQPDDPVARLDHADAADLFVPEVAIADLADLGVEPVVAPADIAEPTPEANPAPTSPTVVPTPAVTAQSPSTATVPQRPPQQLELPIVASDEDLLISPEDLAVLLGKPITEMAVADVTPPIAATVGITPFVLEDGSPGFSLDAPPQPVIQAFRALNLQQRFLTQLRSLAEDDALLDTLRSQAGVVADPMDELADEETFVADTDWDSDTSPTHSTGLVVTPFIPSPDPNTTAEAREIVVDDEVEMPATATTEAQPNLAAMLDELLDEELLPTPELTLIGGNLVAGRSFTVLLRLPQQPNRVGIKLWMEDRQSRAILYGPRLLADFLPDEAGYWETQVQLDVPMGCLEIAVEAIALELHSGRESHKVSINRLVLPPDLPNFALDEFELDAL